MIEAGITYCCCAGISCCQGFSNCLGTNFQQNIRFSYFIIMTVVFIFMFSLLYFISPALIFLTRFGICTGNEGLTCLGIAAVYRISFILFILHFLILISCFERGSLAKVMNEGCWGLKLIFIGGAFIISLWIPNTFFIYYGFVAQYASFIYLLFQFIFIIDFAYGWAQKWYNYANEGNNFYVVMLWLFTISQYLIWIVMQYYMYKWFWNKECSYNNPILIILTIFCVLLTVLNLIGLNPNGSILKASFMMIFITYLTGSAFASAPDSSSSCNPFYNNNDVSWLQSMLGFAWALICLLYLCLSWKVEEGSLSQDLIVEVEMKKSSIEKASKNGKEIDNNDRNQQKNDNKLEADNINKHNESNYSLYKNNDFIFFHTFMAFSSIYFSMLLSNWGALDLQELNKLSSTTYTAEWIKLSSSFVASLFYIWTIVAPAIFPDREFQN